MPILIATAAGAAATYGAYKGGKAAVEDVKRKRECRKTMREHRAEQEAESAAREQAAQDRKAEAANLSVKERLERYKQNNNSSAVTGRSSEKSGKKGLLGRLRK